MFDDTIKRLMSSTLVEASCKSLLSVKPNLFPIQVSYTHIPNLMVQIPALLTYTFIQKRGAEPTLRDFTKIIIFFIYIPSSPRQSTSISLFLKSSYKLQYLTVHCKHKREIDISMDMLLSSAHQSCVTTSLLRRTVGSILRYLVLSSFKQTNISSGDRKREMHRNVKIQETLLFLHCMKAASQCLAPLLRSV